MKQNKKRIPWQQYIGTVFTMLMGAACGYIIVMCLDSYQGDRSFCEEILYLAGLLLGIYVALVFHIIVHEAGHLVFGLLTGYKFSSFRIFSFMWLREDGKLKLRRLSIAGTGGQCLMAPPDLRDGKMPLVLYNLGGSISNIVFSALFITGYLLSTHISFLSALFLIFAVMGFMTALMNGIPMRMGTVDNDGYNAFALTKNTEAMKAFWVQLKVNEQISRGVRLKDMPQQWFEVPSDEAMKNSMVATRGVFACNRLMDAERFEEADLLMAHLLEIDSGIVGLHRNLLICDRIFVELIGEKRSEVIENMLTVEQKKFMKAMKRFPSVLRTEYALALLFDVDRSKAEKIMCEFDKVAKTYPYPHEAESERDLMNIVKDKAE